MSSTQPSAFVPNPAQRRLLDYVDAHPCLKTIQELCAGAGVPSSTYYNWCKNTDFRLWFAASWSARLTMDGVVLLNQARLLASRNFSYWKALFTLTFEPTGFAMLQQWQQSTANLPPDAFTPAPDTDPGAPAPPAAPRRELVHNLFTTSRTTAHTTPAPSTSPQPRLQCTSQWNQPLSAIHWRNPHPSARPHELRATTPLQHIRALRGALR
jgi:hypothetical protein